MRKKVIRVGHSILSTSAVFAMLFAIGAHLNLLPKAEAAAGTNETINYQARLLTGTGAVVADGTYNIQFKIYCGGDGSIGTVIDADCTNGANEDLLWTETRESGNKVTVKNGFFSVYLGSVTAFGSNVNWNEDKLWLTVNIGGTGAPSYDGEMSPFTRFSSTPYALNSKLLGGLSSSQYVQLAYGLQTDASTTNASIAINKTGGTADILNLQKSSSSVMKIANDGSVIFKNAADSTAAFQIQNASGTPDVLFKADTTNNRLYVGNQTAAASTNTTLLIVDSVPNTIGLPTGVNGGIIYDANTGVNKFKVYENGAWKTLCNTTDLGCSAGGTSTLQQAYDASSATEITLGGTNTTGLTVRDSSGGLGTNLFEVQNNVGGTNYFAVTASGVSTSGTSTAAGNFNTTTGGYQINGTTIIDSSKNIVGIGSITGEATAGADTLNLRSASGGTDGIALQVNVDVGTWVDVLKATNATVTTKPTLQMIPNGGVVAIGATTGSAVLHVQGPGQGGVGHPTNLFKVTDTTSAAVDVLTIANEGATTFKNRTDSTTAFQIQNAAGTTDTLFKADTTNNRLYVGNQTAAATTDTTLLVVDSVPNGIGLPTGVNGGVIYDANTGVNKFKVYENGAWKTLCNTTDLGCGAGGGGGSLATSYGAGSAGNQSIGLNNTQDSIIITNPSSSGTDSAFVLQVSQTNTTAAIAALDVVQASNAAGGLVITANSLTSSDGLAVNSSSTGLTGSVAEFTLSGSNASNTGSVLKLSNTGVNSASTGLHIDHRATGTGNLALRIDDQSGDTTPFIVDGDGRVGIGTSIITGTTERLLEVGSGTNRGNAAVYGELVSKGMRDLTALTNIEDIFVYDTTSDSDGGRWIDWATTDKMPWYTEALDDSPSNPCNITTDDRCYSQAFPRKAVLVVTSDSLYIFDGQTNTMWMKFSQNAAGYALGVDVNNDPSSVTALNGVIYVGTNGSAPGGLYAIDLTGNRMWNYDDTDRSAADVGIDGRNSAVVYNSDNNTALDLGANVQWKTINDVSAAVVNASNTPIAATTGPNNGSAYVALATDSGVNLINISHQRLFQYSDAANDDYNSVVIGKTAKVYALNEAQGELNAWINVDSDQASQTTSSDKMWDETTTPSLSKAAPTVIANAPDALEIVEKGSLADGGLTIGTSSDLIYVGTNQGLSEIHDHVTFASGWSKFYNTTRQTALMSGTVRRAHMMDDASGNVTNQSNKTTAMTAKGTPTYGVQGVRGKAMSFNGTSQYLCSDTTSDGVCDNVTTDNLSTGSWTISTWFKHSATIAGTDVMFARCHNTTPAAAAGCVAASMTSTGTIAVNVDFDAVFTIGATGTTVFHNSTQTYNDNQWHQITVTRAQTTGNINTMIDGKPIGQTAGLNTTLDAAQILSIGADCSVGAACATGANFWDGQIDDFTLSAAGAANNNDLITTTAMRRLYNEARPLVNKKVINVTDATTFSTTTIGDSGEAWIPNELAGQVMAITGNTGVGQTRRVVSNTATTMTVSPAFSTAPDATSDFEIDPEALYGASDSVTAIGVTAESAIGEARMLCAGTNSGTDTGGVTCYNHQAGPNIIADVFHQDSEQFDDEGNEWTGTDYDDVQSIDLSGRALVMGSMAHFFIKTDDVKLGQGLDYLSSKIFDIRSEILNDGISLAGSLGLEVGLTGGADLAERFTSEQPLEPGNIVSMKANSVGEVQKSTAPYQKDLVGIVATDPGLILGPQNDNSYPIALSGRVPVKVTKENGIIKAGDRITSSSIEGYGMKADNAGRVLGIALDDFAPAESGCADGVECGTVTVLVNLVDFGGESAEIVVSEAEDAGLLWNESILGSLYGLSDAEGGNSDSDARKEQLQKADKILRYLAGRPSANGSEILAGKVSATDVNGANIYGQTIYAGTIIVDKLRANQIEGLEVFTDKISSLAQSQQQSGNSAQPSATNAPGTISMSDLATTSANVQLDLKVQGSLVVGNGLKASGPFDFYGPGFFRQAVTFVEKTIFKNDISFEGRATFNNDTAGFAKINAQAQEIEIKFGKKYETPPVVTLTVKNGAFAQYSYKDLNEEGFKIILKDPAETDIEFAWAALSVKDTRYVHVDNEGTLRQQ